MVSTLNYEARRCFNELYQEDRWGVLSVLILSSNNLGRTALATKRIQKQLGRSSSVVVRARQWLLDHEAIELVPHEQRVGDELKLPLRQFVYQLTGKVKIGNRVTPYLYAQAPILLASDDPLDTIPEVSEYETSEVSPDGTSTERNLSISNTEESNSKSDSAATISDGAAIDPLGKELDAPIKTKHSSPSALDSGEPLPSSPASIVSDYDVYAAYSEWSNKVTRTLHLAVGALTLCQRDTATLKHLPAGEPDKDWTYSVHCRACTAELDRRAADVSDKNLDILSVPEAAITSATAENAVTESRTNIEPSQLTGNNADRTMRWTDALTGREMAVLPAAGIYQKHFKSVADHFAAGEWDRDEYVYIGRANASKGLPASKWANPFVMRRESEREDAISRYRAYLYDHPELIRAIPTLRNHTLVCWCKPKECHGDVLVQFASMDDAWLEAQAVIADANAAAIAADALAKKKPAKPSAYSDQAIFDAVTRCSWGNIADDDKSELGGEGGRVGKIRKWLVERALKKQKAANLDETQISLLVAHVDTFGAWYDQSEEYSGATRPRDLQKWKDAWLLYIQSPMAAKVRPGHAAAPVVAGVADALPTGGML